MLKTSGLALKFLCPAFCEEGAKILVSLLSIHLVFKQLLAVVKSLIPSGFQSQLHPQNRPGRVSNNPRFCAPRPGKKLQKKVKIWLAFTVLLLTTACYQLFSPETPQAHSQPTHSPVQIAQNRSPGQVSDMARQLTVRIITNPGSGSGVIIGRRGQIYTVLTCEHVVANRSENRYTILTADGRTHAAQWLRSNRFGDTDLALVQFNSNQSYEIAEIGDSNTLEIGDEVYAAGFPNWYWVNSNAIEDTRDWGLRAYRLTTGQVGMIVERSLPRGYQLGYTNAIEQGMSGGPVLNRSGQLIGINGRLKFPPQGIDVYTFADGTTPSQKLYQQMEALSWAIPIATFRQMAQQ